MLRTLTLALKPGVPPFIELHQSLPSKVAAVSPFVEQLMSFITKFRGLDESKVDIEIALGEAVTNAVIHGNREDPSKRVHVTCRCAADGEVSIIVRDEGRGFDSRTVTNPNASDNPFSTHGHGIQLMRWFMDEVRFEEGGTVVHMCKKSNARRQ